MANKKKSLMELDSTEVRAEHREFKHNLGDNRSRKVLGAGKPFEKKPFEFRAGGNQVLVEEFESSDFLLDRTSEGTPIRAKRTPLLAAMMVLDMVPEDFLLNQIKILPEEITGEKGYLHELARDEEAPVSRRVFNRYALAQHIDLAARMNVIISIITCWNDQQKNDEVVQLISNLSGSNGPMTRFEFLDLCVSKESESCVAKIEELRRSAKTTVPYIGLVTPIFQTKEEYDTKAQVVPYVRKPDWTIHAAALRVVFTRPDGKPFMIPEHLRLSKGALNFVGDLVRHHIKSHRSRHQQMVTDSEAKRFVMNYHEEQEGGFHWVKKAGEDCVLAYKDDKVVGFANIIQKGAIKLTHWVSNDVNLPKVGMIELSSKILMNIVRK